MLELDKQKWCLLNSDCNFYPLFQIHKTGLGWSPGIKGFPLRLTVKNETSSHQCAMCVTPCKTKIKKIASKISKSSIHILKMHFITNDVLYETN